MKHNSRWNLISMAQAGIFLSLAMGHAGVLLATEPDSIPGLVFWLKADAGITQSGGRVSVWADQSTNLNPAVQSAPASMPTYMSAGLNGKPVIRFTGAPVTMGVNLVSLRTVFVVYKDNGTTDDYGDLLGGHLGAISFHGDQVFTGKLLSQTWAQPNVLGGEGFVDGAITNPADMKVVQASHIYGFVTLSPATFSNIANNQDQPNRFRKGDYAEIIAFSGALNTSDRWAVEAYLSDKYGIPVVQQNGLGKVCTVYADGDSVTFPANGYTAFYPTDIRCSVVNVAVSGQSQAAMLSRLPAYILSHDPDIVTIATYLNDMGTPPGSLASNIVSYVTQVLAHQNPATGLPPQLILMTDNLSGQNLETGWPRPYALQVDTANRVMTAFRQYADNPNVHIVDNFASFDALGGSGNPDSTALFGKLLSDKVHPNAAGYDIFHANIKPSLTNAANRVQSPPITNAATCAASPGPGYYRSNKNVSLSVPAYAAFTFYTLDGTQPTRSSAPYYGGTFRVDLTNGCPVILKAVSYDAKGNQGATYTGLYVFRKNGTIIQIR